MSQPLDLSYVCASCDLASLTRLAMHLTNLRRCGWLGQEHHVHQLSELTISEDHCVILFLGPDSLELCTDVFRLLEERLLEGQILPVLWKSVDLALTPFEGLRLLPSDEAPISGRGDHEEDAFVEIVRHLRQRLQAKFPLPTKQQRSPTEPATAQPDRESIEGLFADVMHLCRIRHSGQLHIIRRRGAPPFLNYAELRAPQSRPNVPSVLVACDQTPTDALLQQLDSIVLQHHRRDNPYLHCELVFRDEPPAPAVEMQAKRLHVSLIPLLTYRDALLDLRPCVQHLSKLLANDPHYQPGLYVKQRLETLRGEQTTICNDALAQVNEWLRQPEGHFLFLMGDFGCGKTFLLRELARQLANEGPSLTPLFINLRDLDKRATLDSLIADHLVNSGQRRPNLDAFYYMLEQGLVALLFDGYDELALRVTYDRAAEQLCELTKAARGRAKVVVTSRTQHFYSDQQVRDTLARLLPGFPQRILRLLPFCDEQIHNFLRNSLNDEERAARWWQRLGELQDLKGLSQNPRLLGFLLQLDETKLQSVREQAGISAARIYEQVLSEWLSNEDLRASYSNGPRLEIAQRWEAVEFLALHLWTEMTDSVAHGDLPTPTRSQLDKLYAQHQVGVGTLLRRDTDGRFSFLQHSILEWLVAAVAARSFTTTPHPVLWRREFSALMIDFLIDLAGEDNAITWARRVIMGPAPSVAKNNGLLVLKRTGASMEQPLFMTGQDLRGHDLTDQRLCHAILPGADLRDAHLVRADLRGANLREAKLDGADLKGADLRGADLRGASLRRAKLIGARLDPTSLLNCSIEGAALPDEPLVVPHAVSSSRCDALAIHPGGALLASGDSTGTVLLWDLRSGVARPLFTGRSPVLSLAFSPDGRFLAAACNRERVTLLQTQSGQVHRVLAGHRDTVRGLAFSPDGSLLASCADDRLVKLWRLPTGDLARTLEGHRGPVFSVTFSPDGSALASTSRDHTTALWSTRGIGYRELQLTPAAVLAASFSPRGDLLATASADHSVSLWQVQGAALPQARFLNFLRGTDSTVRALAFSPDGALLATAAADHTVTLWQPHSFERCATLTEHQDRVRAVAFTPDGRLLASASDDGTLRLFDVQQRACRAVLLPCPDGYVAYRPDGHYKYAGAVSGRFYLTIGACRFEPGELDPYLPLRLADSEPLLLG